MNTMLKSLLIFYIAVATSLTSAADNVIGMMEIFDGDPSADQCRNCHDNLTEFPMLKYRNPDRHHLLIGTIIPPASKSKAPDAPGAINSGAAYNCFSCHKLNVINIETGEYGITEPFRNCVQCHPAWRVTGSPATRKNVHKETESARQQKCYICHRWRGWIGWNKWDGTHGPTYEKFMESLNTEPESPQEGLNLSP